MNTSPISANNNAGDLTRDKNKGIALINYDLSGHPTRVQFTNGNQVDYVYAVDGQKLWEKHTTAVDGLTVSYGQTLQLTPAQIMVVDSVDYAANLVINAQQSTSNNFERDFDYHLMAVTSPFGGIHTLAPTSH